MGQWTVQQIREGAWARDHQREPYAARIVVKDHYGQEQPQIEVLKLSEVLDMAEAANLQPNGKDRDIPQQVSCWMRELGLCSIYELEEATCSLTQEQRLDILGRWFNGGGGLPRPPLGWGKQNGPKRLGFRLDLGHPSIFNNFLRWAIDYLALCADVDGRIGLDQEALINEARRLKDLPSVVRY